MLTLSERSALTQSTRKNVDNHVADDERDDAFARVMDLPDSEQGFIRAARQVTRLRERAREKSAERRQRDYRSIEMIANAMIELADGDVGGVRNVDRGEVATNSETSRKAVDRLWNDAVALAQDGGGRLTRDRDLRLAYAALAAPEVVQARIAGEEAPYSARQAHLVRSDTDLAEYHRRLSDEPNSHRYSQSARERIEDGYRWTEAGYVGGAHNERGGKYFRDAFVEKGFRSAEDPSLLRIVAATPKVGSRRRGISDREKIQRIVHLDEAGISYAEIADEVGETVSRVRGAIYAATHDTAFRSGLNNDRRFVHRHKRVALDEIHGSLRTDCKEIYRIEKDCVFADEQALLDFVATKKVPPQWITWVPDDEDPDAVKNPHFDFALPEKSGVWYDEAKSSAMLEAVAAAINADYGGDPGGLANIFDTKLPTSPHTRYINYSLDHLPTLSELCRILDVDLRNDLTRAARNQMVDRMVEAGIDQPRSQRFYTLAGKRAWEIATLWRETGRIKINGSFDRAGFLDDLLDAVLTDGYVADEMATLRGSQRETAEHAIRACVRRVAERYGRGRRVNRRGFDVGAADAEARRAGEAAVQAAAAAGLDEEQTRKNRIHAMQSAGQTYASSQRVERNRRRIADAIAAATDAGEEPTVKTVSETVGMDPRTVEKHWDSAVAQAAARRIVAIVTTPAAEAANGSSVRGVTVAGSQSETSQPTDHGPENNPVPDETTVQTVPAIQNILSPPLLRLVNRLEPWNPRPGENGHGRNLLEFCRSGFRIHRPADGRSRLAAHRHQRSTVNSYNSAGDGRAA